MTYSPLIYQNALPNFDYGSEKEIFTDELNCVWTPTRNLTYGMTRVPLSGTVFW